MRVFLLTVIGIHYTMVLKNALSRAIVFWRYLWNVLRHIVGIGAFNTKVHSLIYNTGKNQFILKMTTALHDFFHNTYEFLEPHATWFVQDNLDTGITSDDDEYVLVILAFWKKKDIQKTFCSCIGWSMKSDAIVNTLRDNIHMYYGFNFRWMSYGLHLGVSGIVITLISRFKNQI